MMALRQQQAQQQHQQQQQAQQQHQQQQQAGMAPTQTQFLHWAMQPERPEPTQDFMEQQTNPATVLMPTPLSRYTNRSPIFIT